MQPAANTIVSLISVCLCVLPCGSGGVWVYFPRDKVPSGASCGHHMPVVPPKPAVGPGNDCESGKRSNKPPCKTTTKSTLPSASSKLEKHFTPPHRAGATRTNRLLNFKPLRWRQTPLYGPVCLCISPQYGEHRCLQYPHGRGSEFYPPTGGASRAFGLPQAAAKRLFAGGSPHPLYLRKKEDAACITHQGGESHCIASVRPRVRTIRVQGSRVPNKPEHRRYAALVGNERDKSRRPESLICSIRVPKLNSLKNIVSSLYPAVSREQGRLIFVLG